MNRLPLLDNKLIILDKYIHLFEIQGYIGDFIQKQFSVLKLF